MSARRRSDHRAQVRRAALWLVLLMVLVGELLAYTWCRMQCIHTGYAMTQARQQHAALTAQQRRLKIELAHLSSPQRLARIARERLHLVTPQPAQVEVLP